MKNNSDHLKSDILLLFSTRIIRLFAYGFLSVILVLYLAEIGLSGYAIGLLLSLTLLGDVVVSLWITTVTDRCQWESKSVPISGIEKCTTHPMTVVL